ncbi:MAG TPA: hypothetical protein VGE43_02780 [Acidimicrobiales bacterium]
MLRTRLARLSTAVAAAALLVPALAPAAQAAPAPKVPTLKAVTKIYPHFAGGEAYRSTFDEVYAAGKKCNETKSVKGTGSGASFAMADGGTGGTAGKPALTLIAYRLPSPAKAKALLAGYARQAKKCPGGGVPASGIKSTRAKAFKVNIGDTSQGVTVTVKTDDGSTFTSNVVLVRKGKHVVYTLTSAKGAKKPSVKKSVKVSALTLKTAS